MIVIVNNTTKARCLSCNEPCSMTVVVAPSIHNSSVWNGLRLCRSCAEEMYEEFAKYLKEVKT